MEKLSVLLSPLLLLQGSVKPLDAPQTAPGSIAGAHVKQQQWRIVTRLYEV